MFSKRGSLSRNIIAILIIVSLLPIATTVFTYVADFKFDYQSLSSELCLMDLRKILLLAYDMNVTEGDLSFTYQNDDYHLHLLNDRLILQPGTMFYLQNVEDIHFYTENNVVYLQYQIDGEEHISALCKKEGLYLADFSDFDEQLSEFVTGDE